MDMQGTELASFQIIAAAGTARSCCLQALQKAKAADWDSTAQLMRDAEAAFADAHKAHTELLTQSADTGMIVPDLLLVHSEDQLMSAETVKLLVQELLELYKRMPV